MINSPNPNASVIPDASIVNAKLANNTIASGKLAFNTWESIAETVLAAAATTVQFTGLDLATNKAYMLIMVAKNNAVGNTDIKLEYNGDTTNTNYYIQQLWADNATVGGARINAASICNFNNSTECFLIAYIAPDVSGYPRAITNSNSRAPNGILRDEFFHVRNNVANVTSIEIVGGAANAFAIGSSFRLFKVSA